MQLQPIRFDRADFAVFDAYAAIAAGIGHARRAL
jgi:hypothetical protein